MREPYDPPKPVKGEHENDFLMRCAGAFAEWANRTDGTPEEFGIWSSVKDTLSGVHGVVISRTTHAFGPTEVGIQRDGLDADGKMWELIWLPEARCEAYRDG